jgi:hypothetical protein
MVAPFLESLLEFKEPTELFAVAGGVHHCLSSEISVMRCSWPKLGARWKGFPPAWSAPDRWTRNGVWSRLDPRRRADSDLLPTLVLQVRPRRKGCGRPKRPQPRDLAARRQHPRFASRPFNAVGTGTAGAQAWRTALPHGVARSAGYARQCVTLLPRAHNGPGNDLNVHRGSSAV